MCIVVEIWCRLRYKTAKWAKFMTRANWPKSAICIERSCSQMTAPLDTAEIGKLRMFNTWQCVARFLQLFRPLKPAADAPYSLVLESLSTLPTPTRLAAKPRDKRDAPNLFPRPSRTGNRLSFDGAAGARPKPLSNLFACDLNYEPGAERPSQRKHEECLNENETMTTRRLHCSCARVSCALLVKLWFRLSVPTAPPYPRADVFSGDGDGDDNDEAFFVYVFTLYYCLEPATTWQA